MAIEVCLLFNFAVSQNGGDQFATFCILMGALPKDCALLGGNTNTVLRIRIRDLVPF
jgi:hypothetical protein